MAKVKGTAVRARLEYVRANFGEGGLAKVLSALQPEHRELVRGDIVISEWYPLSLSDDILGCVENLFGEGNGTLCQEIGAASCRNGLRTVYGVFTTGNEVNISDKLARTTRLLWKTYYDEGDLLTVSTGPTSIESELTGVVVKTPWLCHVLTGYIRAHIEVLGGHQVQLVHTECRTRKQGRCRWIGRWKL